MPVPSLARQNPVADLFRGFSLPFRAFRLVFSTPKLFTLTALIAGVTFVGLAISAVVAWKLGPTLADSLVTPRDAWYWTAIHHAVTAVLFLLLLAVGANTFPALFAAPLMDPLSENAEKALGYTLPVDSGGAKRAVVGVARSVKSALARLLVLYTGHLGLLALLLIPVVGAPVWAWAGWLWTVLWLAGEFLDVPMARHLYRFRQELAVLNHRPALCFGFGLATWVLLWVPVLNLFFVPVAVVGGTMLFRGVVDTGLVPPPEARM